VAFLALVLACLPLLAVLLRSLGLGGLGGSIAGAHLGLLGGAPLDAGLGGLAGAAISGGGYGPTSK